MNKIRKADITGQIDHIKKKCDLLESSPLLNIINKYEPSDRFYLFYIRLSGFLDSEAFTVTFQFDYNYDVLHETYIFGSDKCNDVINDILKDCIN